MPDDADLTLDQKASRRRKARILVGTLVLVFGLPPLINAMSNPRLATLRGPDFIGLVASGLCFGFGLALLIGRYIFGGE